MTLSRCQVKTSASITDGNTVVLQGVEVEVGESVETLDSEAGIAYNVRVEDESDQDRHSYTRGEL